MIANFVIIDLVLKRSSTTASFGMKKGERIFLTKSISCRHRPRV